MDYSDITQLGIGTTQIMRGWTESVPIAVPAAGVATVARVIPPATWERLIVGHVAFTTDAVVATRTPRLQVLDGDGNIISSIPMGPGTTASTSWDCTFGPSAPLIRGASGTTSVDTPDFLLSSGWTLQVTIANFDVGDSITAISLLMQRYPSDIASGDAYHEQIDAWRQYWAQVKAASSQQG